MANVKIPIELDFTTKSLPEIKKQIDSAVTQIEKHGIDLNLSKESIEKTKKDLNSLLSAVESNTNKFTGKLDVKGLNRTLTSANININTLEKSLQAAGIKGSKAFKQISDSTYTLEKRMKNTNSLVSKMSETLFNTVKWNVASGAVNRMTGEIEKAFNYAKDLDRTLTDIRIVSGLSKEETRDFALEANKAAKAIGSTTDAYTKASLIFFQQGLASNEVKKMTEATTIGANIAGTSAEQMSEYLTAVINGYGISADKAMNVVDKLSAVGATTAADFGELSTAMSKVAAMANTAGVPIDKLNAQIATMVSVTKQAPEAVGNSLKTIYSRMGAFKTGAGTDEEGEAFSAPAVEAALQAYNKIAKTDISIFKTQTDGTKVVVDDMSKVLEELGQSWDRVTDKSAKFGVTSSIAGTRQQNMLISLLDNWEMYSEAVNTSLTSEGKGYEQNEIYMDSYEGRVKNLNNTLQELYNDIFDPEAMKSTIDALSTIVGFVDEIVKTVGGLPGIIGMIGGLLSKTAIPKLGGVVGNLIGQGKTSQDYFKDKYSSYKSNYNKTQEISSTGDVLANSANLSNKLNKVRSVFGEESETSKYVEKLNNDLLKQQRIVDGLASSVRILDEAYAGAERQTENEIRTLNEKLNDAKELEKIGITKKDRISYQNELKNEINNLKNIMPKNFSEDIFSDLIKNIDSSSFESLDLDDLKNRINQEKVRLGVELDDTDLDNVLAQWKQEKQNLENLDININSNSKEILDFTNKIEMLEKGVSATIPMLTSLFSSLSNETATTKDQLLSFGSAIGFVAMQNIPAIITAATSATTVFGALGASIYAALGPIGIVIAAFGAIVIAVDHFNVTTEEHIQNLNKLKQEYDEINGKLIENEELQEKDKERLKELQRLKEINGDLSTVNQTELDGLEREIILRQRNIDSLKEEQKEKDKEVQEENLKTLKSIKKDIDSSVDVYTAMWNTNTEYQPKNVSNPDVFDYYTMLSNKSKNDKDYTFDAKEFADLISEQVIQAEGVIEDAKYGVSEEMDELLDYANNLINLSSILNNSKNSNVVIAEILSRPDFKGNADKLKELISSDFSKTDLTEILGSEKADKFIESLKDSGIVIDETKNKIPALANSIQEFERTTSEASESVTDLQNTLSKLNEISSGIGKLNKAFEEFSEEGSVSFSTISSLSQNFNELGINIDEYTNKMLSGEMTTNEFNQMLSDLTIKLLDSKFAAEDLNEETENSIAAMLKEEGVANSAAIAHDYIAKKKFPKTI